MKISFPEEINKLTFKQKLWHFLKDSYIIPKCKICGNDVSFETRKNQWGYHLYCSGDCAMHDESIKQQVFNTKELLYGDKNYNNKEKLINTLSKRTDEEIRKRKHLASNMTLENAIRMGYVVNPKLVYCKYDLISSGKMDELRAKIDEIETKQIQSLIKKNLD